MKMTERWLPKAELNRGNTLKSIYPDHILTHKSNENFGKFRSGICSPTYPLRRTVALYTRGQAKYV